MAYIQYKIHPDDPDATEKERLKAYGGICIAWASLGAVIYFMYSMFFLYIAIGIKNFVYSTIFLVLMAIIDFFFIFDGRKDKKEIAKKYFLFFLSGFFCLAGLIGMVAAICFLFYGKSWILLFVLSLLCIGIIVWLTFFIYAKMEGIKFAKIRFFTEKTTKSMLGDASYIYCHKCGRRTLADSAVCPSCETKLR